MTARQDRLQKLKQLLTDEMASQNPARLYIMDLKDSIEILEAKIDDWPYRMVS